VPGVIEWAKSIRFFLSRHSRLARRLWLLRPWLHDRGSAAGAPVPSITSPAWQMSLWLLWGGQEEKAGLRSGPVLDKKPGMHSTAW